ncbi:FGGY-family carbohydrate kinase [Oceanotoga sp. DSM 15011]|uniref:FGGY-family carbohydrate kinase n=1 Tax=unclassified Oceanotoga TaxID=2618448 RepID=UPI0021F4C208|nr:MULTISPECIES: FGGY-family carbohydrate kinase [unclassified Oceanotoga]MDN5343743.1 hypothetical protein [Oceanotoga sp.]UYP00392.1 FGGY-family carbohydrate kinase [Oceanotoga sp. DSM 15011]
MQGDERILSIDCGTQSLRGIIFDKFGYIKGYKKIDFNPYFSIKPGWAEQKAEIYWKSLCEATNYLKLENFSEFKKIDAVVITTLRDTMINLDKNGKVLRNTITWLDQRMVKYPGKLYKHEKLIFDLVGMKKTIEIISRESKANWIKENENEVWNKTYKYIQLSAYLNFKLTGEIKDSISNQVGHIPFNYKKRKWEENLSSWKWRIFGIEKDKLSELVEPGTLIGNINKNAEYETGLKNGIPVYAGASDKGCETLANGCIDERCASISFGTTATIQITSNKYIEPIKFMPAYPGIIKNSYNPEVEIFRGYWMISWFKKEFAQKEMEEAKKLNINPEILLNQRLNSIPAGSDGLILQPYWGPHIKTPFAKGSIIGFGDVHTRIHIYRAIIEGINYGLMDGIEMIESKTNKHIEEIKVSGGGSKSETICQITSDMFNRKVLRIHTNEASGLGAAMIGFVSLGIYKNYQEAIKNMIHYKDEFIPDKKNSEIYKDLFHKVYKRIYPRLKKLYIQIKDIANYPNE